MAQHTAPTTRAHGTSLGAAGRVLSFLVLLLAVLAAAVLVVVPMATGSQTYSVLTNSMRPHFPPGTLLVSRPVPFQELHAGDVITYQLESGRADVINHRIVSTTADQQGNTLLITQGDNNTVADEAPVREIQVRGKFFYAVPKAGFLANWLGNQDRGTGAQVVAMALMGYGCWSVIAGLAARRRTRREKAAAGLAVTASPLTSATGTTTTAMFAATTAAPAAGPSTSATQATSAAPATSLARPTDAAAKVPASALVAVIARAIGRRIAARHAPHRAAPRTSGQRPVPVGTGVVDGPR